MEKYGKALANSEQEVEPLQKRLKELKTEMAQLNLIGSKNWTEDQKKQFAELSDEAKTLQRAINGATMQINILSDNNLGLNSMIEGLSLGIAAFQTWTGVMALAGVEEEEFKKVLMDLQGAMAILNGLETISNKLKEKSVLMIFLQKKAEEGNIATRKLATAAQWMLNKAQLAMPYVALAVGLGILVSLLVKYAKGNSDAARQQKLLNDIQKETLENSKKEVGELTKLVETAKLYKEGSRERLDAITKINDLYGDYLPKLLSEKSTIEEITEAYNLLVPVLQKQAVIRASMDKLNEKAGERLKLAQDEQKKEDELAKAIQRTTAAKEAYNKNVESGFYTKFNSNLQVAAVMEIGRLEEMQASAEAARDKVKEKNAKELQKIERDEQLIIKGTTKAVEGLAAAETGEGKTKDEQIKKTNELLNLNRKLEDISISMLKNDQYRAKQQLKITAERAVADLVVQKDTLQRSVMNAQEKAKQVAKIDEIITATQLKYQQDAGKMEKQFAHEAATAVLNTRLLLAKKGGADELQARKDLINEQLKYELSALPEGHAKRVELKTQADKNIKKLDLDHQIELNKVAIDAAQLRLDTAEKGSQEEYNARMEILAYQRDSEILAADETGLKIEDINKYYEKAELDAFTDLVNAKIAKAQEEAEARERINAELMAAEEAALLAQYQNREITQEKYDEGIADIRHKYSSQAAQDEIDSIKKVLDALGVSGKLRDDIEKELYGKQKDLDDANTEHKISNIKKTEEAQKAANKKSIEGMQQLFSAVMDLLAQQSEAKIAEFDAELERIDEWKERELERLEESVMSDETRAAETKRINEKAEADRKKIEEEKKKEQLKAAKYQKASAIISAIINTALGVTSALTIPPPAGPILAAITAALGAVQIATIAAQPLPKYRHGTDYHEGGYAVVGDAGKHEYALTPAGKLYKTPAVPTLVDMAEGTQVFPDYLSMLKYFRPEIPKYEMSSTGQYEFERMEKNIVGAIRNNKPMQQVQMNLDNNGIWHVVNKRSGAKKFVNAFVHGYA
jgi:hypothetical protein